MLRLFTRSRGTAAVIAAAKATVKEFKMPESLEPRQLFAVNFATPAQPFGVPNNAVTTEAGKFNRDAFPDLVVASANPGFGSGQISVLLGTSSGSFQPTTTAAVNVNLEPTALAVGDFNADGFTDVAVAGSNGLGSVQILLGNGTGNFTTGQLFPPPGPTNGAADIVTQDFDKDGALDIAVIGDVNGASQNFVDIYFGNKTGTKPNGTFSYITTPIDLSGGGGTLSNLVSGDFNGDGFADLAAADSGTGTPGITVVLNDGTGNFLPTATGFQTNTNGPVVDLAVTKINGDNRDDLLVLDNGGFNVDVLLASTVGTFVGTFTPGPGGINLGGVFQGVGITAGNFDGDAFNDFAVVRTDGSVVTVAGASTSGIFGNPVALASPFSFQGAVDIIATNADSDSKVDLVTTSMFNSSAVNVYKNKSTTPTPTPTPTPGPTALLGTLQLVDKNGNAKGAPITQSSGESRSKSGVTNIVYTPDPALGAVGSVKFTLTGPKSKTMVENTAPFAVFGNNGSNFGSSALPSGTYKLIAMVYSGPNATGTLLETEVVTFKLT